MGAWKEWVMRQHEDAVYELDGQTLKGNEVKLPDDGKSAHHSHSAVKGCHSDGQNQGCSGTVNGLSDGLLGE